MGAIMELMDKFLKNQSIIELMDKFLNKLTMGPCNLKRGGTNQPSILILTRMIEAKNEP